MINKIIHLIFNRPTQSLTWTHKEIELPAALNVINEITVYLQIDSIRSTSFSYAQNIIENMIDFILHTLSQAEVDMLQAFK